VRRVCGPVAERTCYGFRLREQANEEYGGDTGAGDDGRDPWVGLGDVPLVARPGAVHTIGEEAVDRGEEERGKDTELEYVNQPDRHRIHLARGSVAQVGYGLMTIA
jgi:hypothetical protein